MSYNPQNPNGQATSANSSPVVVASDQSAIPISASSLPLPTGAAQDSTLTSGNLKAQGNVASGATDSGNPVKVGGVFNSSPPALATGQRGDLQLDTSGNLKVTNSGTQTVSGTVAATQSGTWTVQPGNTANTTPWLTTINQGGNSATVTAANALKVDGSAVTQPISGSVGLSAGVNQVGSVIVQDANSNSIFTTTADPGPGARGLIVRLPASTITIGSVNLAPSATGGWSVSSQTALTTTATVSSAAGKFAGYMFYNPNTSVGYIQVFDTTSAPTLGTTAPTFVVPIPPGAAANVEFANGIAIANGIKIAATTTATGSTTVATAFTGFVLYK